MPKVYWHDQSFAYYAYCAELRSSAQCSLLNIIIKITHGTVLTSRMQVKVMNLCHILLVSVRGGGGGGGGDIFLGNPLWGGGGGGACP